MNGSASASESEKGKGKETEKAEAEASREYQNKIKELKKEVALARLNPKTFEQRCMQIAAKYGIMNQYRAWLYRNHRRESKNQTEVTRQQHRARVTQQNATDLATSKEKKEQDHGKRNAGKLE